MDLKFSKSKSKYLRSLQRGKQRRLLQKMVLEGDKACLEVIRDYPQTIEWIFSTKDWITAHSVQLDLVKAKLIETSAEELKAHSSLDNPSNVMLVSNSPDFLGINELASLSKMIYLDGIQDPGNAGTILRTAAWFGLDAVIFGPGSVDPTNPKVIQASMGAILRIPIAQQELSDILTQESSLKALGLMMNGKSIMQGELPEKAILVVGNEGNGIQKKYWPSIEALHIPGVESSAIDSLNAAIAAAIAMAQWSK